MMYKLPQKWLLLSILCVFCGAFVSPAIAIPIGEKILNGEFGTDAAPSLMGWTVVQTATGGNGTNARASTDSINTGPGASGFGNRFSSAFAVLGDVSGTIGGDPQFGTNMLFQEFSLPALQGGIMVDSYELSIRFRTAFDGTDTGAGFDTFSVFLTAPGGAITSLYTESSASPMLQRNGDFNDSVLISCTDLGACDGTYRLQFQLAESGSGTVLTTNTAAGIDAVSVTAEANLVPTPEPTSFVLFGIGLVVMGGFLVKSRTSLKR